MVLSGATQALKISEDKKKRLGWDTDFDCKGGCELLEFGTKANIEPTRPEMPAHWPEVRSR